MGIALSEIAVEVTLTLEGVPLIATHARIEVDAKTAAGDDDAGVGALLRRAREISTVANSLMRGFPSICG